MQYEMELIPHKVGDEIITQRAKDGYIYEQLAEKMKAHGFSESKASIANKLARGTFATPFYLAALAALEVESVSLEDI